MSEREGSEEQWSVMGSIGVLQGIPPAQKIHHAGVLDLRGVSGEGIARIQEVGSCDVLILDEENRHELRGAKIHHTRNILTARAEERVLITPQLDMSRTAVEAMPDGQCLLILGNVYFAPDVSADLIVAKFATLRVFGTLTAGAGAVGALAGRTLFGNGVTIALPENTGPITRVMGELRITGDYLNELPDGTTFLNFGEVELRGSVSTEMLRQKIRAWYNLGETKGEESHLAVLQARCPMDTGEFEKR